MNIYFNFSKTDQNGKLNRKKEVNTTLDTSAHRISTDSESDEHNFNPKRKYSVSIIFFNL